MAAPDQNDVRHLLLSRDRRFVAEDRFQRFRVSEGQPQSNDAAGASPEHQDVAQIEIRNQGGSIVSVPD